LCFVNSGWQCKDLIRRHLMALLYTSHKRSSLLGLLSFVVALLLFGSNCFAAQLRLSWSDNSDNEEGFEIQRRTASSEFATVSLVGANTGTFVDSQLTAGETYCYRIRAFNAVELSDYSDVGCGTTPTTLTVSRFGSGAGTVVSSPPGIDCGSDCAEPYSRGTIVTLTPIPSEGSSFYGWNGGGCLGASVCIFNVDTDMSVTALFENVNPESTSNSGDPAPPTIAPPLLSLTGLNTNIASPQMVGTSITLTASATGGVSPLEFKWWIFDGYDWRIAREWGSSDSYVWTPERPGNYIIGLWGRSTGNSIDSPENSAVLTQAYSILPLSCPSGKYLAEFYNNMSLSDGPVFSACDSTINYVWGDGGPGNGIGSDNFAVRWTGTFPFTAGSHRFTATADDGIRAWVDGVLIIDAWVDQGPTTYQSTVDLSDGEHLVQVEYYENGGGAVAQFNWQRLVTSNPDYYVMFENNRLAVDAPGVLGNDHDLNANPLTATLVSTTSNGILELNPDGSFNYTPNPNFSGIDSFVYQAGNGSANSDLASVVITVTQVNDVPVATNDSFVVFANDSWAIDAPGILANDNDLDGNALTAALINTTTHGTLALNSDGSFIYTPNAGFVGTDTFTYVANDGQSDSNLAMVTITVAEPNVVPVAQNDGYETNEGSLLTVLAPGVLSNDFDANNNPLTAILVTAPLFGTVTLNSDGSFDYVPTANFSGTDSFSYKVTDGSADSNVAMVTINVNAGSGI